MDLKRLLRRFSPTVGTDNESNRDEWVRTALATIPVGGRLLDAGAGPQNYRKYCAHLRYVSQDFARYDGFGNEVGLQTGEFEYGRLDIVSDIVAIPERDGSFDAILCTEVLEHLPDPIAAVREFARLLRQGGTLLLTAPFCSLTHFAPYHYSSGFSRYWYEKHLTESGFLISSMDANGDYFAYLAQELRRLPQVAAKYANRRMGSVQRLASLYLSTFLSDLKRTDRGSAELLCYGYHVRAERR